LGTISERNHSARRWGVSSHAFHVCFSELGRISFCIDNVLHASIHCSLTSITFYVSDPTDDACWEPCYCVLLQDEQTLTCYRSEDMAQEIPPRCLVLCSLFQTSTFHASSPKSARRLLKLIYSILCNRCRYAFPAKRRDVPDFLGKINNNAGIAYLRKLQINLENRRKCKKKEKMNRNEGKVSFVHMKLVHGHFCTQMGDAMFVELPRVRLDGGARVFRQHWGYESTRTLAPPPPLIEEDEGGIEPETVSLREANTASPIASRRLDGAHHQQACELANCGLAIEHRTISRPSTTIVPSPDRIYDTHHCETIRVSLASAVQRPELTYALLLRPRRRLGLGAWVRSPLGEFSRFDFSPGVVEPVPEVERVPLKKKTRAMSSASEAVKNPDHLEEGAFLKILSPHRSRLMKNSRQQRIVWESGAGCRSATRGGRALQGITYSRGRRRRRPTDRLAACVTASGIAADYRDNTRKFHSRVHFTHCSLKLAPQRARMPVRYACQVMPLLVTVVCEAYITVDEKKCAAVLFFVNLNDELPHTRRTTRCGASLPHVYATLTFYDTALLRQILPLSIRVSVKSKFLYLQKKKLKYYVYDLCTFYPMSITRAYEAYTKVAHGPALHVRTTTCQWQGERFIDQTAIFDREPSSPHQPPSAVRLSTRLWSFMRLYSDVFVTEDTIDYTKTAFLQVTIAPDCEFSLVEFFLQGIRCEDRQGFSFQAVEDQHENSLSRTIHNRIRPFNTNIFFIYKSKTAPNVTLLAKLHNDASCSKNQNDASNVSKVQSLTRMFEMTPKTSKAAAESAAAITSVVAVNNNNLKAPEVVEQKKKVERTRSFKTIERFQNRFTGKKDSNAISRKESNARQSKSEVEKNKESESASGKRRSKYEDQAPLVMIERRNNSATATSSQAKLLNNKVRTREHAKSAMVDNQRQKQKQQQQLQQQQQQRQHLVTTPSFANLIRRTHSTKLARSTSASLVRSGRHASIDNCSVIVLGAKEEEVDSGHDEIEMEKKRNGETDTDAGAHSGGHALQLDSLQLHANDPGTRVPLTFRAKIYCTRGNAEAARIDEMKKFCAPELYFFLADGPHVRFTSSVSTYCVLCVIKSQRNIHGLHAVSCRKNIHKTESRLCLDLPLKPFTRSFWPLSACANRQKSNTRARVSRESA
ncbi:unnamed protein product, partial [Trichogramma brassicae]